MLDRLRERITAFLSEHQVCILSTAGSSGAWAMPVRYLNQGLEVECLLPCWADVTYHLELDPRVMLVIQSSKADHLCWMQYWGTGRTVISPTFSELLPEALSSTQPDQLFVVTHVIPDRIDLVDESRGWGARETLEL